MASLATSLRTYFARLFTAPPVRAELLYQNPLASTCRYEGIHGTQWKKIAKQVESGTFENQGKHVYVYPNYKFFDTDAAFWAGNKSDSVLVEVGSKFSTQRNRSYNTLYFPKDQEKTILRVWDISDVWKSYAWKTGS